LTILASFHQNAALEDTGHGPCARFGWLLPSQVWIPTVSSETQKNPKGRNMAKQKREYKIKIKDLPENITPAEFEKVKGGIMTSLSAQLNLSALKLTPTHAAGGDCDCWSHTACACKCAA
jgi:hypothetical protein